MTLFIGADHRGIELKNAIIEYFHEKNVRIEDLGPYELDPLDDAIDYSQKVSNAVLQNPENDLCNVIALAADYTPLELACKLIESFISSTPKTEEKYLRRIEKLDK